MPKRSPGLRVAFECGEDWTRFAGDGATRLCDRCVKQVHDISTLTRSEAAELIVLDRSWSRYGCRRRGWLRPA